MASTGARGLHEAMRGLTISAGAARTAAGSGVTQRVRDDDAPLDDAADFPRPSRRSAPLRPRRRSSLPPRSGTQVRPPLVNSAPSRPRLTPPATTVPLTIHAFPTLEPLALESHPATHLHLPLRRDLLHAAVTHEASLARQGTASSKTRWDIAGSHRKIRPQKGTGQARQGSRQSPGLRGGAKAHGPHPRDFSTKLQRKVYDKAWRTALSYRYRRGELVVCADGMELDVNAEFWGLVDAELIKEELRKSYMRRQAKQLMAAHGWGKEAGRTLFVTSTPRNVLFEAVGQAGEDGRALEVSDVDVKDLLTEGRVVVEREALRQMIAEHQSDLVTQIAVGGVEGVSGPLLTEGAS